MDAFDMLKDDLRDMDDAAFEHRHGTTRAKVGDWLYGSKAWPFPPYQPAQATPIDVGDDDLRHSQRTPQEAV